MSIEAEPEENAFELDDLVIQPSALSTSIKTPPKAVPRKELFARITKRHCKLLAGVDRVSTVILFHYLMICSIQAYNRPFVLPVEYLARETGMNRRSQVRALRNLAGTGIIKIERENFHSLPTITIPGTTKTNRRAT